MSIMDRACATIEWMQYLEFENERLRAALVAAKTEIEWWADEHRCCKGHQAEAIEQIDAALAKPAI